MHILDIHGPLRWTNSAWAGGLSCPFLVHVFFLQVGTEASTLIGVGKTTLGTVDSNSTVSVPGLGSVFSVNVCICVCSCISIRVSIGVGVSFSVVV